MARIFPLYIVIFIGFLGYSMMVPLFTALFLDLSYPLLPKDASTAHRSFLLGVVLATYPLGQFFGSSILGALSDRFGRKRILSISLLVSALCYIGVTFSLEILSFSLLLLFLLIAGLSEANIVIAQSAIADVVDEKDRAHKFGYIYVSASLAYIIGPLLGGQLANPSLVSWFNYGTPFMAVVLLLILTLLWILAKFQETSHAYKSVSIPYAQALTNIKNIFIDPRFRFYYLVNFLLYLSIFGFFRVYAMYIEERFHVGISLLSEMVAYVALPIILVNSFIIKPLSTRFSPKQLTLASAIGMGIFMAIIVFPPQQHALWITLFLATVFLAVCMTACATMISQKAEGTEQGRVLGNNQSMQVLAEALSAFLGGVLATLAISLPLLACAFVALLASFLLWRHK